MSPKWITFAAMVLSSSPAHAKTPEGIRCDGRLVSMGSSVVTLRARCGEPLHKTTVPELVAVERRDVAVQEVRWLEQAVEYWTYRGPSGSLARLIEIREGKLATIRTLQRTSKARSCERADFSSGTFAGQVVAECGLPAHRSRAVEEFARKDRHGHEIRVLQTLDTWTYDPGPGRFLRVLTFENGRLARVDEAERSPSR